MKSVGVADVIIRCGICKIIRPLNHICKPLEISAEDLMKPKTVEKHGWKFNKKDMFIGNKCLETHSQVSIALDGEITAPTLIKNKIDHSQDKPSGEVVGEAANGFAMAFQCRFCEDGYMTKSAHWKHEVECADKHKEIRTSFKKGQLKQVQIPKTRIRKRGGGYLA